MFTAPASLPTSADPRIASENFTSERVAAIVTVTGRYIGPMSRHPEEREVAILPATLKTPVGSMIVAGLANPVVLLTEPGHAPGLPPNQHELERVVREQITDALACPPAPTHSPGRFAPSAGPTITPVRADEVKQLKVLYSTPSGDTNNGEQKLFLLEQNGVRYVPVFRSMDSIREFYERMDRAAYMVIEGDVQSVIDTTRSIELMKEAGIVVDPFGDNPVVIPPAA
ncbi:SseB family protein [Mycolicibacterium sp.]|uniref:SseB family protein n=1 Tax=Mycolicibacterium sp. TaxID=2320850 RepID=UPI0037CA21FC